MTTLATQVALLVAGIGILYFGAEWLVRGSARIAATLGVSPIVVGLTVVSFGTSAPELVVCLVAALGGNSDLAMGNVLGSNMANIGLILGITAMVRPLDVAARVVWREGPLMVLVTIALYPILWDHEIQRSDGVLLLIALAAYLFFVFQSVEEEAPEILDEYQAFVRNSVEGNGTVRLHDLGLLVAGSLGLVVGGYVIVTAAETVAVALNIPQGVIGLTLVAVGTSLPELATSVVAAIRKETDIAVGNVIGSNIFNLVAILGTTSAVHPIGVSPAVLSRQLPAVIILSVFMLPILRSGWCIRRWEGGLLVMMYLGLFAWLL
ncbi:MAG: calcium/sodium antiporter [Gemmatimonadota bacterium]|nr:calcium/sodium antiporter [Gemmatimonadota bacterium]MDH5759589.1 calcium/sodium antiporter [Gemmatimonadota bacterium]